MFNRTRFILLVAVFSTCVVILHAGPKKKVVTKSYELMAPCDPIVFHWGSTFDASVAAVKKLGAKNVRLDTLDNGVQVLFFQDRDAAFRYAFSEKGLMAIDVSVKYTTALAADKAFQKSCATAAVNYSKSKPVRTPRRRGFEHTCDMHLIDTSISLASDTNLVYHFLVLRN